VDLDWVLARVWTVKILAFSKEGRGSGKGGKGEGGFDVGSFEELGMIADLHERSKDLASMHAEEAVREEEADLSELHDEVH
jgi:hypothetical protein